MPFNIVNVPARPRNHEVLFYSDGDMLVSAVTNLITPALMSGNAAIVLATKPHRDLILEALRVQGIDIKSAIGRGT
jgi:hypothetical protein